MMFVNTIILVDSYLPGSASSNRMLCYAKGYSSLGLNTIMLLQCEDDVELPVINGVNVVRVQESNSRSRVIRIIKRLTSMITAVKQHYKDDETVIHIWNVPLFVWFLNKKKYAVFCEIGEIPNYAESGSFIYHIKEKLRMMGPRTLKGLIVQTNSLADYYLRHGVKNIVQSNMFVDVSRFNNLKKNANVDAYIAYCGTVSKHKDGVDDLIKAFKIVHDRYNNFKLMIIGGFTSAYQDKEELENLVKELSLEESVVFTGMVHPSAMPQLLLDAAILALARPDNIQAKYGFPTKVGEYLCTGNPSVLTKVGELPMFLEDMKNCVFAKADDYKDFADKLIWTIEHRERATLLAEEGKKLVNSVFSADTQCEKLLSFFESLN